MSFAPPNMLDAPNRSRPRPASVEDDCSDVEDDYPDVEDENSDRSASPLEAERFRHHTYDYGSRPSKYWGNERRQGRSRQLYESSRDIRIQRVGPYLGRHPNPPATGEERVPPIYYAKERRYRSRDYSRRRSARFVTPSPERRYTRRGSFQYFNPPQSPRRAPKVSGSHYNDEQADSLSYIRKLQYELQDLERQTRQQEGMERGHERTIATRDDSNGRARPDAHGREANDIESKLLLAQDDLRKLYGFGDDQEQKILGYLEMQARRIEMDFEEAKSCQEGRYQSLGEADPGTQVLDLSVAKRLKRLMEEKEQNTADREEFEKGKVRRAREILQRISELQNNLMSIREAEKKLISERQRSLYIDAEARDTLLKRRQDIYQKIREVRRELSLAEQAHHWKRATQPIMREADRQQAPPPYQSRDNDSETTRDDDYGEDGEYGYNLSIDEVENEGLSFNLPIHDETISSSTVPNQAEDNTGLPEALAWKNPQTPLMDSQASTELFVIHAMEYSMDEMGEGKTTLICPAGPRNEGSDISAQMRWLHIRQQVLDFKVILKLILNCPYIPKDLLPVALRVVEKVEAKFSGPSECGPYLEPGSIIRCIGKYNTQDEEAGPTETEPVIFLSSPYLALHRVPNKASSFEGFYPRTLLQSLYGYDVGSEREASQVVQNIGMATSKKELMHVNQAWCLLIGSGILITVSEKPAHDLRGQSIILESRASGNREPLTIRLTNEEHRQFNIVIGRDYNYVDVLKYAVFLVLGNDSDASEYELLDEEQKVLTPKKWKEILDSSQTSLLGFSVVRKDREGYVMSDAYDEPIILKSRLAPRDEEEREGSYREYGYPRCQSREMVTRRRSPHATGFSYYERDVESKMSERQRIDHLGNHVTNATYERSLRPSSLTGGRYRSTRGDDTTHNLQLVPYGRESLEAVKKRGLASDGPSHGPFTHTAGQGLEKPTSYETSVERHNDPYIGPKPPGTEKGAVKLKPENHNISNERRSTHISRQSTISISMEGEASDNATSSNESNPDGSQQSNSESHEARSPQEQESGRTQLVLHSRGSNAVEDSGSAVHRERSGGASPVEMYIDEKWKPYIQQARMSRGNFPPIPPNRVYNTSPISVDGYSRTRWIPRPKRQNGYEIAQWDALQRGNSRYRRAYPLPPPPPHRRQFIEDDDEDRHPSFLNSRNHQPSLSRVRQSHSHTYHGPARPRSRSRFFDHPDRLSIRNGAPEARRAVSQTGRIVNQQQKSSKKSANSRLFDLDDAPAVEPEHYTDEESDDSSTSLLADRSGARYMYRIASRYRDDSMSMARGREVAVPRGSVASSGAPRRGVRFEDNRSSSFTRSTSSSSREVSDKVVKLNIVPFFSWRLKKEIEERSQQEIEKTMVGILQRLHVSLASQDVSRIYSRTYKCTVKELLQRHDTLLELPQSGEPILTPVVETTLKREDGQRSTEQDASQSQGVGQSNQQTNGSALPKYNMPTATQSDTQTPSDAGASTETSNKPLADDAIPDWRQPQSIQMVSHDNELMKKLLHVSKDILSAFVPQDGSPMIHHVCVKFWGCVDTIFRQLAWHTASAGLATEREYVIRDFDIPSTVLGEGAPSSSEFKSWSGCSDCRAGTHYPSANKALEHLHQQHMECPTKTERPYDDPCFVWLRRIWSDGFKAQTPGIGIMGQIEDFIADLLPISNHARELHGLVASAGRNTSRTRPPLPRSLVDAFNQVLIVYIMRAQYLSLINRNITVLQEEGRSRHCENIDRKINQLTDREEEARLTLGDLLQEAKKDIILLQSTSRHITSLGVEAVGAEFLAMALIFNVQNNNPESSSGGAFPSMAKSGFMAMYQSYAMQLRFRASSRPQKRVFLDIHFLEEELDGLHGMLTMQRSLLKKYIKLLSPGSTRTTNATRIGLYKTEKAFARIQKRVLRTRDKDIGILRAKSQALKNQVKQTIEILEEDHGKAIRVFTIVTLFFLPLSFVSSFMGMNTKDIRDMEFTQRIFWETGLPVTVVVVFVALVYGYKGDEIADWFVSRTQEKSHHRGKWAGIGVGKMPGGAQSNENEAATSGLLDKKRAIIHVDSDRFMAGSTAYSHLDGRLDEAQRNMHAWMSDARKSLAWRQRRKHSQSKARKDQTE